MGQILELKEGDPIEVHEGLRSMIFKTANNLNESSALLNLEIKSGVQFNSRDFYFREPEILEEIIDLYNEL